MREHVVAAAKAMRNGNWNACANFIVNKKMNTKVWDLFYEADRVREMLTKFIKEEALRTYLFTYSNVYTSLSIPSLASMFEIVQPKVHSLISKMIINEELMASLDDPTETVVMHRSEPSRLQALSMQLADKVTNLVDANERIFEMKQGNFFQRGNQVSFFFWDLSWNFELTFLCSFREIVVIVEITVINIKEVVEVAVDMAVDTKEIKIKTPTGITIVEITVTTIKEIVTIAIITVIIIAIIVTTGITEITVNNVITLTTSRKLKLLFNFFTFYFIK